ncbi:MAG: response regulator [Ferruginibacter sp.]
MDDAVLITKRIANMIYDIENENITVFVCNSYEDSLAFLENNTPQIILMDIHLGEKSGIDLLEFVTAKYPSIKVVMVSNKASEYYRDLCAQKGCYHFIDKSKEFEMIPKFIETLC